MRVLVFKDGTVTEQSALVTFVMEFRRCYEKLKAKRPKPRLNAVCREMKRSALVCVADNETHFVLSQFRMCDIEDVKQYSDRLEIYVRTSTWTWSAKCKSESTRRKDPRSLNCREKARRRSRGSSDSCATKGTEPPSKRS